MPTAKANAKKMRPVAIILGALMFYATYTLPAVGLLFISHSI
jgi:hypothetical protein